MINFWEDTWFGTCNLATMFWDIYFVCNEQNRTIAEVWDGVSLKLTFRQTFDEAKMQQWFELVEICKIINFSAGKDQPIWMYNPDGVYSVSSFYAIVNNPGIKQIHTPAIWNIVVPPRIHVFLWLYSNNKLLTRDNLAKRRPVSDPSCLYCNEPETSHHLFCTCVVATFIWDNISDIIGREIGNDFLSIARLWVAPNNCGNINVITSATL